MRVLSLDELIEDRAHVVLRRYSRARGREDQDARNEQRFDEGLAGMLEVNGCTHWRLR